MQKEVKQLQLNFDQLRATMAAAQAQQKTIGGKVSNYKQQLSDLAQIRSTLQQTARATGDWRTETFKTVSASQKLTQTLVDQKLGAREAFRAWKNGYFKQMINEQHSLRNAFATQMTGSGFGKSSVDLYAPKGVAKEIRSWTTEMGTYSEALRSVSQQTINWGKNTQWAGRQMMVGLTVPLGIAAVGMAKSAYEVDKQLTNIAKVYDTQSTVGLEGTAKQAAAERELAALRVSSLDNATSAAKVYGAAVKDTLDVESQLAATGLNGSDLTQATTQVVRIATLGQLEYQDAIDTTVALQTAFKLNNEELTESFNMMNAVENATSLSIKDITEAVPRAASALSALGGTVQDMTVMLVAMRESGVDPAIAANAIKSATSALLDPTKEAITYWKQTFNVDLPQIVEQAGGNVYKVMQQMAKATRGFDPLLIQKGINNTFGRYQFDRISGLFTNLGDAMNGFSNQTKKAMDTVGMSASDLASVADNEMQRMQQSISGRFKRAIESLKAEFIPLGTTILGLITPVVEKLQTVVGWFNDLGDTNKGIVLWGLALMGLAGPLVMITGILGNLLGHALKVPAMLGGLVARFRPMTAEMTANALVAKRAAMTWDAETSSAAMLTQSVNALTTAMEANAIAQGHMLSGSGVLNVGGASSGVSMYRSESGQLRKRTVSDKGKVREARAKENSPEGQMFNQAEAAAAAKASSQIEESATRTKMSWQRIAGAMGGVAMAAGSFAMMDTSSASIGTNLMNAAMFASSFAMMLPSLKGASAFAGKIGNALGGKKFAAMGKGMGEMVTYAGVAAGAKGFGGVGSALTKVGGALFRILPNVLRVFGPVGIIAGGIALVTTIYNKMTELSRKQDEINKSTQDWASILGYVETKGAINGVADELDTFAARVDDVNALKEANESLVDSLTDAKKEGGDFGRLYNLAVREALKVATSGGTAVQAKQAFTVALQAAGLTEPEIDRLTLKFDKIDLKDPKGIRDAIASQINDILLDQPINIEAQGSWWNLGMAGHIDAALGNGLNDEAEAAAKSAGQMFAQTFNTASGDIGLQSDLFRDLQSRAESQFMGPFKSALEQMPKETQDALAAAGITGIDSFTRAVQQKNPAAVLALAFHSGDAMDGLMGDYTAWVNEFVGVFGKAAGMSEDEINGLLNNIHNNLASVASRSGASMMSLEDAQAGYNEAIAESKALGEDFTAEQQLATLNVWRAARGLGAATDVAQGFGEATAAAAGDAESLNVALEDTAAQASSYTNALKSAMSGAWGDIFSAADKKLEEANDAELEAIQDAGDIRQKGLENQADALEKSLDGQEKTLEKSWDNREKMEEDYWDNAEKQAEDYYDSRLDDIDNQIDAAEAEADARTDAIQAVIDAEDKAEQERQKRFEAEKNRISRLAEMANTNIDFNAALNSGDLDEAAKIQNTGQATTSQWALDDSQANEQSLADQKRDEYQRQIDGIERERAVRTEALEAAKEQIQAERDLRLQAIKDQRDAAVEATKAAREAEMEAFNEMKKTQQESIRLAQEESRERTQADTERAKKRQELDRETLAAELAALREYVPQNEADLQAHIGRVQAAYEGYGHGLQVSGDQWSKIIGDALTVNVDKAAAGLQTEIDWKAIGTYISDNISKGTGLSMEAVKAFLLTGKFPETPVAPAATPYTPNAPTASSVTSRGFVPLGGGKYRAPNGMIIEHDGGHVGDSGSSAQYGSPNWSQSDRVGVQRSASLYPSEYKAVLKQGEFVVNAQDARKNIDILRAINNGRSIPAGDPGKRGVNAAKYFNDLSSVGKINGIHHQGGPIDATAGLAAGYGLTIAKVQEMVGLAAGKMINSEMAGRAASSDAVAYTGGLGGSIQNVLSIARAQEGKPYIWGGAGVAGSDCSGFMSILQNAVYGKEPPYGRRWATGSFAGGKEIDGWKRGGGPSNVFRIGVDPNSHTAGTFAGINVESGSGHGPMVGKRSLGANSNFRYQYYLPAADRLPQLRTGGTVKYDNTLANLHRGETVLTAPLTSALKEGARNVDFAGNAEYTVEVNFNGPVNTDLDIKKAIFAALDERESRNGKTRKVTLP